MALRNRLVRLVGLKDLGQLHDAHPPASRRAQATRAATAWATAWASSSSAT